MSLYVAVDFAETLVKERPMIEWVLFELKNSKASIWWKMRFMLNSFVRGFMSILFGKFRLTSGWSARVAYMSFKGISKGSLKRIINHRKDGSRFILSLNPDFMNVLPIIKRRTGLMPDEVMDLSIHSQGTCARAIGLFINRQDVAESLKQAGISISGIFANRMEIVNGKFTGQLLGQIMTKFSKPEGIPDGAVFIGDSHDERAIKKLKNRKFEFINYKKFKL